MGIITTQHSFEGFTGKGIKKIPQVGKRKIHEVSGRSHSKRRNQMHDEIFGEKLSVSRILETLSKDKLEDLIRKMILEKPEVAEIVERESPCISIDDALIELRRKLELIVSNLPYKVDVKSDYAYLRVKNHVIEFFQALSDYSLNFLPPVNNDYQISIKFLMRFLKEIFAELPKFDAIEFNYYYNLTIEKFNLIFIHSIKNFLNERKQNLIVIKEEKWDEEMKIINEHFQFKFDKAEELIRFEIENNYNLKSLIIPNEGNSIKLTGLENLINFAYQTSAVNSVNNI